MRLAGPADAQSIYALRVAAQQWMSERGVDQWQGEVSLARVQRQIAREEWYVAPHADGLAGALRLLWSDPDLWPADEKRAGYVHGLMIDRSHAGRRLGEQLLGWAEAHAAAAGATVVRLDCVDRNVRLRRYYAELGFREVGHKDFPRPHQDVVLLEKAIHP